ncbi:MAG: DinB family protein [Planctomycetaceae bacterium]|nr:DinB family protein [Planctomycetaceae bacterium]
MSSKECLERQLVKAREYTEKMLADFKTPADWTHQVHKNANHALWFVGHMCASDNFFISVVAPERAVKLPFTDDQFGMGSQPVSDAAAYPPPDEVLTLMRERRATLLDCLAKLDEADLAKPTPKELADFCPTIGGIFEMAVWHEGLHSGQVSVARRAIGAKPVFG